MYNETQIKESERHEERVFATLRNGYTLLERMCDRGSVCVCVCNRLGDREGRERERGVKEIWREK